MIHQRDKVTQRRFWGCPGYPHRDGVEDQASDDREMKHLMNQLTEEVRSLKLGGPGRREAEELSPADRKEAQAFQRRQMYDCQVVKGRFRPSRRANPSGTAQIECRHDFEELVWGGNGSALYARCSACLLRNVVYYGRGLDKQSFMTGRSGVQHSGSTTWLVAEAKRSVIRAARLPLGVPHGMPSSASRSSNSGTRRCRWPRSSTLSLAQGRW